jgi:hypothetical protein
MIFDESRIDSDHATRLAPSDLPPDSRGFLNFEPDWSPPSADERDNKKLQIALRVAAQGWPVIPCRPRDKARRTPKGTEPSTDPAQIIRWWTCWPDCEIGIVITDVPVVVLDPDGSVGLSSSNYLSHTAGTGLPDTFITTTGRPDGGQHRWYRLPPATGKLINQLGHDRRYSSATPGLDILFNGLVIAPGSTHKSGNIYTGNYDLIPRWQDLPELPQPIYDFLAKRGQSKASTVQIRKTKSSGKLDTSSYSSTGFTSDNIVIPKTVQALLDNISDGRNLRTLIVVTRLLQLGATDSQIIGIILNSPLGDKAREQPYPDSWLRAKIETGKRYPHRRSLDRDRWWWYVRSFKLTSAQIRICDALLSRSHRNGYVTISQGRLGIQSASINPSTDLAKLEKMGLLLKMRANTVERPAAYQLLDPPEAFQKNNTKNTITPTIQCVFSLTFSWLSGHDAFRCKSGSLHQTYPVLTVLIEGPQTATELSECLRLAPEPLARRLTALKEAGLVSTVDGTLQADVKNLRQKLDAAAEAAGTLGMRAEAEQAYKDAAEDFRKQRREAGVVGSDTWRKMTLGRLRRRIRNGEFGDVDQLGMPEEQFAERLVDRYQQMLLDRHPSALGLDGAPDTQ